jgi:hypothetical protein
VFSLFHFSFDPELLIFLSNYLIFFFGCPIFNDSTSFEITFKVRALVLNNNQLGSVNYFLGLFMDVGYKQQNLGSRKIRAWGFKLIGY